MNAGLVKAWDAVRFSSTNSASWSAAGATNGVFYGALATSYYCPDPTHVLPFVDFEVSGFVAAAVGGVTGTNGVTLTIGPPGSVIASYSDSSVTSFPTSASFVLVIHGWRLYMLPSGAWEVTWTGMDVTLDGVIQTGVGAGSFVSSGWTGQVAPPVAIPFIGIPPQLGGGISAAAKLSIPTGPLVGGNTPFSEIESGSASGSGGWEVMEVGSGVYTALPVDLSLLIGGGTGCPCDPTSKPTLTCPDTNTASWVAGFYQESSCTFLPGPGTSGCPYPQVWPKTTDGTVPGGNYLWLSVAHEDIWSSSVYTLPNIPKALKRFGPDYAELIFRGGLPQCTRQYFDTCFSYQSGSGVETGNVQLIDAPFPRESSFLGVVGNAMHAIESPLRLATLAPYGVSATKNYSQALYIQDMCPTNGTHPYDYGYPGQACYGSWGSAFGTAVDALAQNPQMTVGLYHTDALSRYVNYWSSPLWNYALWFPPDEA